jgi:hypothetical protein
MKKMLYRIVIQSSILGSKIYYLTSDKDIPETDSDVNLEKIEFLSKINARHAHTFSTEEKAKEIISTLPFPYNEKCSILEVSSVDTKIVSSIFYRVAKKGYNRNIILWANPNKSFTESISNDTLIFTTEKDAEEFIQSLKGLNKRFSFVVKIKDYGEPDYQFDAEYLIRGKSFYDISEIPGIIKLR